jgi:hypothetical protein
MSVIYKTKEEMQVMTGGLLFHLEKFREDLITAETFQKIKLKVGECNIPENFEETFIFWLMHRMWIANKVAYTVQYGDSVELKEDLPEVTPLNVELGFLSSELSSLNYNIYTNAGQYWLDQEWHGLFKVILKCIKEKSEISCPGGTK